MMSGGPAQAGGPLPRGAACRRWVVHPWPGRGRRCRRSGPGVFRGLAGRGQDDRGP